MLALVFNATLLHAETYSGTCGDDITWSLNTDDGVLTITGTGDMNNYSSNTTPWYDYRLNIKSISITDGVSSIGDFSFCWCNNLTLIDIPNSIRSIGKYAFYDCKSIESITIPSTVTRIGYAYFGPGACFNGCVNLKSVHIADLAAWCNIDFGDSGSNPLSYAHDLYLNDELVQDLIIPDGVTSIKYGAFEGCSMHSVTIPNSVTSIGTYAFYSCSSLTSVTIPDGVTSIGSGAFWRCSSLTSITIPDGVTSIEGYSFSGCSSLTSITIPDGVTSIGNYAFNECSSLTSVTIPEGVTSIGDDAFSGCSSLTSVTIPNSVTSIGDDAFSGCSSLTSVTIPNGVTSIGYRTFDNCSKLETIYSCSTTPPTISSTTFYGIHKNAIVYVLFGTASLYKEASYWKDMNIQGPVISNTITAATTSCTIAFDVPNTVIASCGIEGGEQADGNVLEYIGLEPNSEYNDIPVVLTSNTGLTETIHVSFTTSALELTTQPSKAVSSTTTILLAETNMSDAETGAGFEWKRNDAPADMAGTKVYCPVANGTMAGRLKNLNDQVYYKYRAFYQSSAGNMYYGDWQYIFTGDNAVVFDPVLYTYAATAVKETEATLKGYALAGSDDFTEQGFEYWAESRVTRDAGGSPAGVSALRRMPQAAIGEHQTVQASGISMKVTLTDLDQGTVYKYRTYAIVGGQTVYGSEMSFTTKGEYVPPTYTITFVDYDGTELLVLTDVAENATPEYTGETPTRAEDEEYTYTFSGWSPAIVAAIEDATYTATYEATKKVTGLEDIFTSSHVKAQKMLINGTLYIILPDGTRYNACGAKIK